MKHNIYYGTLDIGYFMTQRTNSFSHPSRRGDEPRQDKDHLVSRVRFRFVGICVDR